MTKKKIDTTHVLMIADMSGSMAGLEQDVRGGFNSYVESLRLANAAGRGGSFKLTMVTFNTTVEHVCRDAPLEKVPELTRDNYAPHGCTALLDAVGKTVTEFESRVKLRKTDRVLVVVQTDGFENSSHEWTFGAIQKLIKDREAAGQWNFIYFGAGTDTWTQASAMGFERSGYINTPHTSSGTSSTYTGLGAGTILYSAGTSWPETAQEIRDTPGVDAQKTGDN